MRVSQRKSEQWLLPLLLALSLFLAGCWPSSSLSYQPLALAFHAEWCRFCPSDSEIDALKKKHPNVKILWIDIDREPALAKKYHVSSVPRFFLCDESGCRTTKSFFQFKVWLNEYQ